MELMLKRTIRPGALFPSDEAELEQPEPMPKAQADTLKLHDAPTGELRPFVPGPGTGAIGLVRVLGLNDGPDGRGTALTAVVERYLRGLGYTVAPAAADTVPDLAVVAADDAAPMARSIVRCGAVEAMAPTAGFDPEVVRLAWCAMPWGAPASLTTEALEAAHTRIIYLMGTLLRINDLIAEVDRIPDHGNLMAPVVEVLSRFFEGFHASMCAGFDTAGALVGIEALAARAGALTQGRKHIVPDRIYTLAAARSAIVQAGQPLGLLQRFPDQALAELEAQHLARLGLSMEAVERLIAARVAARQSRDFSRADAILAELHGMGVELMDGPWGTRVAVRRPEA